MALVFARADKAALPLTVLEPDAVDGWLKNADAATRAWVTASGFSGRLGSALMLPGVDGAPVGALAGYGTASARARVRFPLAGAVAGLAPGTYRLASGIPDADLETEALGWLLTGYSFTRYRKSGGGAVFKTWWSCEWTPWG